MREAREGSSVPGLTSKTAASARTWAGLEAKADSRAEGPRLKKVEMRQARWSHERAGVAGSVESEGGGEVTMMRMRSKRRWGLAKRRPTTA